MASHIEQATTALENNALAHMNAKSVDREFEKKKCAFGNIKNAPVSVTIASKSAVKKGDVATFNTDDDIDQGYTSLRPVDFFEAWVEKTALSDDDIDRWIKALRDARNANPYDETEPPPQPEMTFDDDELVEPIYELPPVIPPSEDDILDTPTSDSSDYESCTESIGEDQPSELHDSEISALNISIFEFEEMSGDEDDF